LEESFGRGEFVGLREWLREKIHRHGKRYRAAELIRRATGKALDPSALIESLSQRYG
jgi:carboxypeptidase Taq